MNLLFTVFGGKFKFQAQDSFSEYFFLEIWRSKKRIALSEKKPPLVGVNLGFSKSLGRGGGVALGGGGLEVDL